MDQKKTTSKKDAIEALWRKGKQKGKKIYPWTKDEIKIILEMISQNKPQVEISRHPSLGARHTEAAITTFTWSIKKNKNVSAPVQSMIREILIESNSQQQKKSLLDVAMKK